VFLVVSIGYAIVYQLIIAQPVEEFGFGVVHIRQQYQAIPQFGLAAFSPAESYDLFAASVVKVAALTHYYFDSFIWKVSDSKTREGL
jgi:hypothetical protein